jgi:5-methyltetrahydropteroyltriglutamate--homocysteine methyltransferase
MGLPVEGVFMTAVSPGILANFYPNRYYPTREAYLEAVSEVMKREYEAIVTAGFILQLDCPDLALRSTWFPDLSIQEIRTVVAQSVEALNAATRDIPEEPDVRRAGPAGGRVLPRVLGSARPS